MMLCRPGATAVGTHTPQKAVNSQLIKRLFFNLLTVFRPVERLVIRVLHRKLERLTHRSNCKALIALKHKPRISDIGVITVSCGKM